MYEAGKDIAKHEIRIAQLEEAVAELHKKVFPDRYKKPEAK